MASFSREWEGKVIACPPVLTRRVRSVCAVAPRPRHNKAVITRCQLESNLAFRNLKRTLRYLKKIVDNDYTYFRGNYATVESGKY